MAVITNPRKEVTYYNLPEIIGWGSLVAVFYLGLCWLIAGIVALFFNGWGWGFGFGWYLPLFSALVVIIAGIGIFTFFLVCVRK